MIEKQDNQYIILDDSQKWQSKHPLDGICGPLSLTYKKDTVITDCAGYAGTFTESNAVAGKNKEYHKAGESYLETEGFIPGGDGRIDYKHIYRYSNRRLRVTTDVRFSNFSISRHFGEGSLFLPGKWKSIHVVPAAFHQVHGAQEFSRDVPEYKDKAVMLGHWHRPPLAVTFIRPNGTAIEVGTGSDIWRWEENLGYSPESGSYKISLEKDGIRFIREPLACCESFTPEKRPFRFSWYIAWRENGALKKLPNHKAIELQFDKDNNFDTEILTKAVEDKKVYLYAKIDFKRLNFKTEQLKIKSPYDYIRGIHQDETCWSNKSVITLVKKIIRKLVEIEGLDGIIFKNFSASYCYKSSHVNKKHENGTAHWDINGLFDFASWTKNCCKDSLDLYCETDEQIRPSMTGLFE